MLKTIYSNIKKDLKITFSRKKNKIIKTKLKDTFKPKIIRNLNEIKDLNKNWNILTIFEKIKPSLESSSSKKLIKYSIKEKSNILTCTALYTTLDKELLFLKYHRNRQLLFFIQELYNSLKSTNLFLIKENFLTSSNKSLVLKQQQLFINYKIHLFYKKSSSLNYMRNKFFFNKTFIHSLQKSLIVDNFILLIKTTKFSKMFIPRKFLFNNYKYLNQEYIFWEEIGLSKDIVSFKHLKKDNFLMKKQKITSFIKTRNLFKNFYFFNNYKRIFGLKSFIWKKKSIFYSPSKNEQVTSISKIYNKNYNFDKRKSSLQLLYVLSRIEAKIILYKNFQNKSVETANLNKLRNLLLLLLKEKKKRSSVLNLILLKQKSLAKYRRQKWIGKLLKALHNFLLSNQNNLKFITFTKLLLKKLRYLKPDNKRINLSKINKKKHFFQQQFLNKNLFSKKQRQKVINQSTTTFSDWKKRKLNVRRTWTGKKMILTEKDMNFIQKKMLLSTWIGKSVDIIFINALSLTKFAFKLERLNTPNNNANLFLSTLDRDFINKYKYIGIYIKDLIRVAFISVFLKKPSFLAKFVAFQISKLPKNRKETIFIRFLIKVIKTFAAERKEILGVRIRFKGRVNRWRRTKFILGNRGTLPLQTISERIEQGTAQAVNRKGALGIRIWLRYKISFAYQLKGYILTYIRYSRALHMRRLKRNILLK